MASTAMHFARVVAFLIFLGMSVPPSAVAAGVAPAPLSGGYTCSGDPFRLFNNWNTVAVSNGGRPPNFSTLERSYCLSSIVTYHWNDGVGAAPGTTGTISLAPSVGPALGPWPAVGSSASGVANAHWTATPTAVVVINGSYQCVDSSPTTWSQNSVSGGLGFCQVWVRAAVPVSDASFAVSSLDFGNVRTGTTMQQTLAVTNTGTTSWISATPSFSGPAASDYTGGRCPAVVAPGAICTLFITFTPSALGARNATMTLVTSPVVTSDSVALSGTGVCGAAAADSATLCVGTYPRGIAVNQSTGRAYVVNFGANTVSVIQLGTTPATSAVVATVSVGTGPFGVAVDPTTNRVYVANQSSHNVTVIDGATNAALATVGVGRGPIAVAVNTTTHAVYVGNNQNFGNTISVIDGNPTSTNVNTVVKTITLANGYIQDVAVNNVNGRVYAVVGNPTLTLEGLFTLVSNAPLPLLVLNGKNPTGVAVNETTGQVWVSTNTGVTVVNDLLQTVAFSVATAGHEKIAVNKNTNRGFAPGGNSVAIVDGVTQAARLRAVGTSATGVGVHLATGFVLAANYFDGTVTIFQDGAVTGLARCRTTDGTTVTPIPLGATTVQILSGSVVVASVLANPDGTYVVMGLAPNSTYEVRYRGVVRAVVVACGVTFTTDAYGNGTVPDPPVLLNRKNHTWFKPFALTNGTAIPDVLTRDRQKTWYTLDVTPQQIVTVRLSRLSKNYTLVAFRDLRKVVNEIKAQSSSLPSIKNLAASLGDVAIDDIGIDDIGIDDIGIDDIGIGTVSIDDIGIDDIGIDDIGIDDIGIDDIGIDDIGIANLYSSVQRRGLRGASVHRGTADQVLRIRTRNYTGPLYFRVAGRGGVFDPGNLFNIEATAVSADSSCGQAPLFPRSPNPALLTGVTGKKTLILTNTDRLGLTGTAATDFVGRLNTKLASRPEINGVVVDLHADTSIRQGYADWTGPARACVHQARTLADSIHEVVDDARRTNPIEYLVIVGGNLVVPYGLLADRTELARESRYSEFLDGATAGEAALSRAYIPTDDFYAASRPIQRLGRELYIPEIAVGRLVESVADIDAYIDAYGAGNGVMANPASALVTGYDFLIKLANATSSELQAAGATVDTSLVSKTWSSADVRSALLQGPARYGYIGLEAHFTASRLVPADNGLRLSSLEFEGVTDGRFKSSHVVSVGCHSGYNIQDVEATDLTQPRAFPEVLLRQGATLYAQTGYAYGDTVLLKNSEALMLKYTRELRLRQDANFKLYGSGVPVGKALVNAKRAYLDELLVLRAIDEKVMAEATIYGLPMFSVALPLRIDRPQPAPIVTTPRTTLGLSTTDVTPVYALRRNPTGGTALTPSYFDAGTPELTQTLPGRPILPRAVADVRGTTAGGAATLARGAVFLRGTYSDMPFTPLLATPVTQDAVPGPTTYLNAAFTPIRPFRLNVFVGESLVFAPMQYLANAGGQDGTARAYDSITARVYYSTRSGIAAVTDAPAITDVRLTETTDNRAHVEVLVSALNDPGVEDVFVTYTGTKAPLLGKWDSVQLSKSGPPVQNSTFGFVQRYATTAATDIDPLPGNPAARDPLSVRLMVQAVSGIGAVSVAANDGLYYRVVRDSTTAPNPKTATKITLTAPAQRPYGAPITVTASLADANAPRPLAGRYVIFRLGSAGAIVKTDTAGSASATFAVQAPPGAWSLDASYLGDTDALGTGTSATVVVTPAPTSFQASPGPIQIEYSAAAMVATLVANSTSALGDRAVTITLNDGRRVGTYTDGFGRVSFNTMDFGGVGAGSYTLTLAYPGDNTLDPATSRYAAVTSAPIALTVTKRKATVAFRGGAQPVGIVTLASKVTQDPAGTPGDLTRAVVSYVVRSEAGITVATPTAAVAADGTSTTTLALAAGLYSVDATVGGVFFTSPTSANNPLPVFDPLIAAAGAGTIRTSASSIGVPGGRDAAFAFAAGYLRAPALAAATGGTLPEGSYALGYTFVTPLGESSLSATAAVRLAGGARQIAVADIIVPPGVTALNFYLAATPAGAKPGFVIQQPADDAGTVYGFVLNGEGNGAIVPATTPTGVLVFDVLGQVLLPPTFVALGTPTAFNWLVVSGTPANHGVLEGTGMLNGARGMRFRVTVDKAPGLPDRFRIVVWDPARGAAPGGSLASPLLSTGGPVTPLPLEDDPSSFGIVFR